MDEKQTTTQQNRYETPHTVTINDAVWTAAGLRGESQGIKGMSTLVRLLLQAYADGEIDIVAKPAKK